MKKFGSNEVLKGVDFKVEKGSVIAVLGNSGSGKTTLLRCISFLEQADKGEITFDDFHKDITAVTRKEIRQLRMKMGFVFQGYNLFRNKTALDNVLEGLTIARKNSPEEAKKKGYGNAGKSRHGRPRQLLSGPAFRWSAAACGYRKSHCLQSGSSSL